jgi:hypothetical protein
VLYFTHSPFAVVPHCERDIVCRHAFDEDQYVEFSKHTQNRIIGTKEETATVSINFFFTGTCFASVFLSENSRLVHCIRNKSVVISIFYPKVVYRQVLCDRCMTWRQECPLSSCTTRTKPTTTPATAQHSTRQTNLYSTTEFYGTITAENPSTNLINLILTSAACFIPTASKLSSTLKLYPCV